MRFRSLIKSHRVVLNKSMLPKMVESKEKAWNEIKNVDSKDIGKLVTISQLKKTP